MEFCFKKIYLADNGKEQKRNNGKNRTTLSRKHQHFLRIKKNISCREH